LETTADKWRAFLYAIGVHLLCVGVMFLGLLWTHTSKPISVAGSVVEATLVMDAPASSQPSTPPKPQPRETAPKPQPKPAPNPQDAVEPQQSQPQAQLPNPDVVEQEKAALLAQQRAEEKARKEQEERRRQEQIELDEQKRQEAEEKQRLAQMQAEQQKQLDDLRRRREEAEKRRKLEEERLAQLQDRLDQTPRPQPNVPQPAQQPSQQLGNNGVDNSLLGRYTLAIQQAVLSNWLRPDSAQPGIRCVLRIVQIPGGEVIQVSVTSPCNVDDLTRRSIEAAVLKAQPLPYRGYESVFQRDIKFNFRYDG
jgi:colicin import membrane protein